MTRILFATVFLLLGTDAFAGCAGNYSFENIIGTYDVDLTIGKKVLHDKLRITQTIPQNSSLLCRAELKGEYEVPGRFTAALEGGRAENYSGTRFNDLGISFQIHATENGGTYPVFFSLSGSTQDLCELQGAAYTDSFYRQQLGEVRAHKIAPECRHGLN